jgi:hypothetical protein
MLLTKLKIATAVLAAAAVLGAGAAALTQRGLAQQPANRPAGEKRESADQPVKENAGGDQENAVSGVVKAVDADKNSLTVAQKDGEKTFTLTRDADIIINGRPGNLTGLRAGARVVLSPVAGSNTARRLEAVGPQHSGVVKAVDVEKNTLTITNQEVECTFAAAKNATVEIDGKPGKLAGLPPGASVTLSWFADQKTARSIQANGPWWDHVLVQAVDPTKDTITFADGDRQPPAVAGKTLPVAKDANIRVDGKPGALAGLPPGAFVTLSLSADQKTVRGLDAAGSQYLGVFVLEVDAVKGTVTFADGDRQPAEVAGRTFPVAKDANIRVDGKPGKLAGVLPGACVNLVLSVDRKTVGGLDAEGRSFDSVLVKSVEAEKNTITFGEYDHQPADLAGKTLPLAKGANIRLEGRPGRLAEVPPGAFVGITLSVDQKAVSRLGAEGWHFDYVLVKSVEAEKDTITFGEYDHQPAELADKTFPVTKDVSISIDDKPSKLAGVPPEASVSVTLSFDQKTVRAITAQGPQVGGGGDAVVEAVDAEKNTITVDVRGEGEKTYPVAKDARIELDGKRGKLAEVPKDASVVLTLCVDQNTVRAIQAKGP